MEKVHILILVIVVLLLLKNRKESFDVAEDELQMIASMNDPDKLNNLLNTVRENGKYMIPLEGIVRSLLQMILILNNINSRSQYFSQNGINVNLMKNNIAKVVRKAFSGRINVNGVEKIRDIESKFLTDQEVAGVLVEFAREVQKIKMKDLYSSMGVTKDQMCRDLGSMNFDITTSGKLLDGAQGERSEIGVIISFFKTYMTFFAMMYEFMMTNMLSIARECGRGEGMKNIQTLFNTIRNITITQEDKEEICQSQMKEVIMMKAKLMTLVKESDQKDLEISSLKTQRIVLIVLTIIFALVAGYKLIK